MHKNYLKSIEIAFRNIIVYPLLRILIGNKPHTGIIDLNHVKSMLIFRQDRIGDMIISTPIFRKIKKEYPHIQLSVLASALNASVVSHDPNIDNLIIKEKKWTKKIKQIFWLRRQKYEIMLNFIFNKTTTIGIFARFVCPHAIKISQGPEKYRFYFNHFLTLERGKKHTGELYIELVEKAFGLSFKPDEFLYEISIPTEIKKRVHQFISEKVKNNNVDNIHGRFILLNISATNPESSFSTEQIWEMARYLTQLKHLSTVLISAPCDNLLRQNIVDKINSPLCISYPENGSADLKEIAELAAQAIFAISPDTSIIHFASAMRTPVLGIYSPLKYTAEWYPYAVDHIIVKAGKGKPVSDIPVETIIKNLR